MIVFSGEATATIEPNGNQNFVQYGHAASETFLNFLTLNPPVLEDYASSFTASVTGQLTHLYVTMAVDSPTFNDWTSITPISVRILKDGVPLPIIQDLFLFFDKTDFGGQRVLTLPTAAISPTTLLPGERIALRTAFIQARPDQSVTLHYAISASVRFLPI